MVRETTMTLKKASNISFSLVRELVSLLPEPIRESSDIGRISRKSDFQPSPDLRLCPKSSEKYEVAFGSDQRNNHDFKKGFQH